MPILKKSSHSSVPIKTQTIIRLLMVIVVILSFVAGYYHSLFVVEHKKYLHLEDMYVRVRMMIGREEMQRLIDESYKLDQ
jgi:hypothetical protein